MTFSRKYERKPRPALVIPETPPVPIAKMATSFEGREAVEKENAVVSKPYRRAISKLKCYRCKIEGHTQVCHGDENKGMGLKTSDLTCWPGCGPHDGIEGCHHYVSRVMSKEERREFEKEAAAATILQLIVMSQETGREAGRLRKVLRDVGLVS